MTDNKKIIEEAWPVIIKQAFTVLSHLRVKEVILPWNEYHRLKDVVNLGSGDLPHIDYREIDGGQTMWIYGVEVKHDGIL
jgi:hypothetical protein